MLHLTFNLEKCKILKILCLGAHSDDIEIGCGGTILKLVNKYPSLECSWVVFGSQGQRSIEAQVSANTYLKSVKQKRIDVREFRDGFFPYIGTEIKECFEQLKQEINPDIIFTHYRHDLHQDHRLICELTWNTFRNHLILEYEIPKYDGDFGSPNIFSELDKETYTMKIEYLFRFFKTQTVKRWFTSETFLALMRLRGVESQAESGFAEAFYCRKLLFP